ncbi:hypothetical protein [Algoriphagus halophilus]|uniref:DoxX protein n=1 Tax=Algoriphagus halophilus TaxID=226505 RepID=A0A1N6E9S3_9BACT|nr:hypothetical protein [Algoriphagus halophilus]SIN79805.1 hypothetical protein SAMN05444394_1882 [Algoriphagus halophilus]
MNNSNPIKQFALLSLGVYILSYGFPFPLDNIPFTHEVFSKYVLSLQEKYILFFGKSFLGLPELEKIQRTGSGDTTFDYVKIPALMTFSFLVAIGLFSLKKVRIHAVDFYQLILIYARYYVGLTLISYGIAKFLIGQFPGPSFYSMDILVGDISPMGLAWRFFGYSDTYKIFMGLSELIAGFLLLFRRTAILGALVAISVCLNIVLVNFSFDVPVKLFSSHLLFFSILILLPGAKALFDFLILHKPSKLELMSPLFTSKKWKTAWVIVNIYLVGVIPLSRMYGHYSSQEFRAMENEWEGLYTGFENEAASPWTKIIVEKNYLVLKPEEGTQDFYTILEIKEGGMVLLKNTEDEDNPHELSIKALPTQQYELKIRIGEKENTLVGSKKSVSDYQLTKRGFHWINEYPFNR